MPAATTKSDLISVTEKDWAKLEKLLATVPADLASVKVEDGSSIKDIVTHRTHWIGLFFQWLAEGEAAQMPDHGVKWNQLKPYNAGLRTLYADLSWAEATDGLAQGHARLLDWIKAASEAELYGGPMPGGNGKWSTGRFAEASGPSHYRSATKAIRGYLKTLASD